jgi:hypothetical protein
VEEAEESHREALARAGELHMRPLPARCRLDLGTLLARTGRAAQARSELAAAADLLRALGMDPWRRRAAAELAALGDG